MIGSNEISEACIWNSSVEWPIFFIKMFESHVKDYKNISLDDCLMSIFNKLDHKQKFILH
jgi:hypothetical protein